MQIYFDALGKKGALGFMGVLIVIQFLIGLSLVLYFRRPSSIPQLTAYLDCSSLPPGMGLLARRRPPLLRLLPPRQQTHPLPAGARDRRAGRRVHRVRAAVPDQLGRGERAVLAVRRQQLRRLGHAHPLPADLGQDALHAGRVLHGAV